MGSQHGNGKDDQQNASFPFQAGTCSNGNRDRYSDTSTLYGMIFRNVRLILLSVFLLGTFTRPAFAQRGPFAGMHTWQPAELQSDLNTLVSLLRKHHPALHRYCTPAQFDRCVDSLRATLDRPLTELEFLGRIAALYPLLGDGHTLLLPSGRGDSGISPMYLPLDVAWIDTALYLRCDPSRTDGLQAGARILAINGMAAAVVMDTMLRRQVRDGHDLSYPRWILDRWFRPYFRFSFGQPEHFELELEQADGSRTVMLTAQPSDSIGGRCPTDQQSGISLSFHVDSSVALLSIPTFDRVTLPKMKSSLKDAFVLIAERGIEHLILDLRGNQGGDPAVAKVLLAHLLNRPFTLVAAGPASGPAHPVKRPCQGRLYTLMDGGSFSVTTMVLAQLELHQRGPLIGEESGGDRTVMSGSGKTWTLPHTGMNCTISTRQWLLVDRKDDGHGVMPTHPVARTIDDVIQGRDAEFLDAIRMTTEHR